MWPFRKKNKDLEAAIALFYVQFPIVHPLIAQHRKDAMLEFEGMARTAYRMSYRHAVSFNCDHEDAHEAAMTSVFSLFSGLGLEIGWVADDESPDTD